MDIDPLTVHMGKYFVRCISSIKLHWVICMHGLVFLPSDERISIDFTVIYSHFDQPLNAIVSLMHVLELNGSLSE